MYRTGIIRMIRPLGGKLMGIDRDEIRNMLKEIVDERYGEKDTHTGKQVHVWLPVELYDTAKELVSTGAFRSLSELVRMGVEKEIDTNLGLIDQYKEDASTIDIGIGKRIDGTVVYVNKGKWDAATDEYRTQWMHDNGIYTSSEYNAIHGIEDD